MVRKGAKLERSVLLPDLPKISRLTLKFPLAFVDTPASAFALFQGLRNAQAATWCAQNFHTTLIPNLAKNIHTYSAADLQDVLKKTLRDLDAELLKSQHAYSACSAAIALLLGDKLVVAGVGQTRMALLFESGDTRRLLACNQSGFKTRKQARLLTCQESCAERERAETAGGTVLDDSLLHRGGVDPAALDDARRILAARHVFAVLGVERGSCPSTEKEVQKLYRKLALRVHPDKASEENKELYTRAFGRLESAKEGLEKMICGDKESRTELLRVLSCEVHTREGAAELLGVDSTPTTDTEATVTAAAKASRFLKKAIEKMEGVAPDYQQGVNICEEAVETLRRGCTAEGLPKHEALLRLGLPTSRCMGARDMRFPGPIVQMEPETASWQVASDKRVRLAILCGATAAMEDRDLASSTVKYKRHPKAAALRWCLDADPAASSVAAVCIGLEPAAAAKAEESGPAAKRARTSGAMAGKNGEVFLRHILFRHNQLKVMDPSARRDGSAKDSAEAEVNALQALEKLIADPNSFAKLCRELSDCQTAENPGNMAGHIGWIARGQEEQALEDAAFALTVNEFGDIVTTSRGVHVIQRMG
eukprot:gnl/TRDRNA2_/TRDRNA2_74481_c0_seq1.p1 gnl/TRDRNA2_/TRDRNA2_74481_c0~~gnl/TRDRNA2_/TRDRNA2_74481_c0_seq1.p1  ORF type:complete len:631 (-),score=125.60 gnl/TRDRNA2_/TRDRNA2_74481_c0_seq1:86-1867(-)